MQVVDYQVVGDDGKRCEEEVCERADQPGDMALGSGVGLAGRFGEHGIHRR